MIPDITQDQRWWTKPEGLAGPAAHAVCMRIREDDSQRREAIRTSIGLYGNTAPDGHTPLDYLASVGDRLTLNVVRMVTDTLAAKVAKGRPKPMFLTEAGNFTLRRKARQLERFVEGQFYASRIYETTPIAFVDACLSGTGAVKIFRRPGSTEIVVERALSEEIYVDAADAIYGAPRAMYQLKWISKEVLKEMFPDKAAAIATAQRTGEYDDSMPIDRMSDQVLVVEAWRLPSDSAPGQHVIATDAAELLNEEWNEKKFPFAVFRWARRHRGFFGQGLAEQLVGIQVEINRLLRKIQKAFHLLAVPRVFVESGSRINAAHMNNTVGTIVPYTGRPPTILTPQTIHPEMFSHLDTLYQRAFDVGGITMDTATSTVPQGLTSGRAILAYNDAATERFQIVVRAWEQFHLDIAEQVIVLAKQIHEEDPSYSVVASNDRYTVRQVRWADVDMERDQYTLRVYPASVLPDFPTGKLQFIESMVAGGFIQMDEAKVLLDFPDLDSFMALDRAVSDYIERAIELMLDEGKYEPPEPFLDHQLALKKVIAAYHDAVNYDVPEDRLQLLREYMDQLKRYIRQAQVETANLSGAALPGAPPALPSTGVPLQAASAEQPPLMQ